MNIEETQNKLKELVITSREAEVQIALLEDKKLIEIHRERNNEECAVGDVFFGKVKKIIPGLNAAFVNIGDGKDAFLHYLDLGFHARSLNEFVNIVIQKNKRSIANFKLLPEVEKTGRISDIIQSGHSILVQIAKEPISTKGARLTSEISLAGRFIVLVPFMDKINISQKIKNGEERNRLKKIVQSIRPKRFGIIIRTVAQGKNVDELTADLNLLLEKWKSIVSKLPHVKAPVKIASEEDKITSIIRDVVNESFESVHVDNRELFLEIKSYLSTHIPEKKGIVKLYKGKRPIFEEMNIALQIKSSFGKIVILKQGVYLVIEHTEAMHVIDVNSGNRIKSGTSEENAMRVNLEAATEIVRQLRLRDMGGIITIDFIDLAKAANRTLLYRTLQELMRNDKAKHTILPVNKFGIVQITRQRVRETTIIETSEVCPTCKGTGKIKSTLLIQEDIENLIEYLVKKQLEKGFYLAVHPFVKAYLTKGFLSKQWKWLLRFHRWIQIIEQPNFSVVEFKFYNNNKDEIIFGQGG
ncbi:MAG: Rne/Rng family ribonuclease [Bacteroidales bacterium]|jgi:ribonuclease G|nr:Rne/Rng family ribonuclease [Bacteroidales bacterium]